MARPRSPNSLRSLAAKYGVSQEAVRKWKKAGIDVTDEEEVRRHRGEDSPFELESEPETLTEARRLKVLEDTRLVRLKIAVEEGKLVPVEKVEEAGVRIGVVVKQSLLRLENDLPPMLEGLSAGKMKGVLKGVLRNLLQEMANFSEEAIGDAKSAD